MVLLVGFDECDSMLCGLLFDVVFDNQEHPSAAHANVVTDVPNIPIHSGTVKRLKCPHVRVHGGHITVVRVDL